MDYEQLQVLVHGIKFAGFSQARASSGLSWLYGVDVSDDMRQLVDTLFDVVYDSRGLNDADSVDHTIQMIRALSALEPADVDEACDYVENLNRFVSVIKRDVPRSIVENEGSDMAQTKYLPRAIADNSGGDVYVCGTAPSYDRIQAMHDVDENNIIIVDDGFEFVDAFGWKRLESLSLAPGALKAYGVSDETRENILGRSGTLTDWIRTAKYRLMSYA